MHPFFKACQGSVAGRIKARILAEITGSTDHFPSDKEVIRSLMKRWKESPEMGRILFHLLFSSRSTLIESRSEIGLEAARSILTALSVLKPINVILSEEILPDSDSSNAECYLIQGHNRPGDISGYYVAIFREESFPKAKYMSIAPPGDGPNGDISILGSTGWRTLSLPEALALPEFRMILRAFEERLPSPPEMIDIKKIKYNKELEPPDDPECEARIMQVLKNEMRISLAEVPFKSVVPHNLDHCFKVPEISDRFQGSNHPMLVYWKDNAFVMSDDYPLYNDFRRVNRARVRVAIMGDFPPDAATVLKVGGSELMPAILLDKIPPEITDLDFKQWQLDRHLSESDRRPLPSDQIAKWLGFAEILSDDDTTERDIHNFLVKYPIALSAYGKCLRSEVRLGNKFRIDLIIESSGVRDEVLLVELEHHEHTLFTNSGRLAHKITHAVQQVKDWFQWIREHPSDPLSKSLAGLSPKGLVVVGKSRKLSEEERSRLAHINQGNDVEVVTYDELLDRFGDLILDLCDNSHEN